MQYFQAVQAGKRRAAQSQMRLFKIAGFAMLTLTTKKVDGKFMPVDEEDYAAVIEKDGYIVLLVDKEGYTKAQTKPLERDEAASVFAALLQEVDGFAGNEVEIWTERYPVVKL